jgi:hypothetical protein
VTTGDQVAEVERLVALGARRVEDDAEHVVLADPDDNEFCLRSAGRVPEAAL